MLKKDFAKLFGSVAVIATLTACSGGSSSNNNDSNNSDIETEQPSVN